MTSDDSMYTPPQPPVGIAGNPSLLTGNPTTYGKNGHASAVPPASSTSHSQVKPLGSLLDYDVHDEGNAQCVIRRYDGSFLYSASMEVSRALLAGDRHPELDQFAERLLTPIEYRIWYAFYESACIVAPHQLVNISQTTDEKSLWVHIRRLRAKLAKEPSLGQVDTVRGKGYVLLKTE